MARLTGVLYLLTMLGGGIAQQAIAGPLLTGDAATTGANILAHPSLYRAAFAVYLIEMSCQVAMTVLFFQLLAPVGSTTARLSLAFGLTGCGVKSIARVFFIAPLLVLGDTGALGAFTSAQREGLAQLFLRLNHHTEVIAMVFFGVHALLQGYLIARSGFLPRVLGVASMVGGIGWLTYLYEPFAERIVAGILTVAVVGSFALALWLIVVGVREDRWFAKPVA